MSKEDRITPLLLNEQLSEQELAYWRKKEPWNFLPIEDDLDDSEQEKKDN